MSAFLLAVALANRPLALAPDDAAALLSEGALDFGNGPAARELYRCENGVARIFVRGSLMNRIGWFSRAFGLQTFDAIKVALNAAAGDPRVRGIVLDIDSPGGEAAGAIETAAVVRRVSAIRPVIAFVDALAASAAYIIAAGARQIIATPSATLGSIGVVWLHLDQSARLAAHGIKPTLLHAGAYKG